ncbi:hypothetical protein [Oscillatoria sp. FACHB-1406]|uniref:hypothetical protein n=1 Tax=Oscillatoria sp. FACHB-1406 TaxID=2692846 RepID=UPI001687E9C6|nr:hypothetical protein [Oscillatoria sp. FACHB-1406]MBD2576769.1 hypothetical protein [Oscillatoria sp. FACHB-1406]
MRSSAEPFQQAKQQWDLEQLYRDLAKAKHQYCDKVKPLTLLETACLRGLLCGCSPPEIAAELNRETRGLRVDLSRGLYRYVEILAGRNSNELKDWRDVATWLSCYQININSVSISEPKPDSILKIVDISLAGTSKNPVLDVKVRNIGQQVAFLKRAEFQFYKTWTLYSWIPQFASLLERHSVPCAAPSVSSRTLPEESMTRSRTVQPSYDYEVSLEEMEFEALELQSQLNSITSDPATPPCLVTETFSISQCVAHNDVDRFTLSLIFPPSIPQSCDFGFITHVYHLCLEIVYDEDDKIVKSQNIMLAIESESVPPLHRRAFFYTPDQIDLNDLKNYSLKNQSSLDKINAIDGLQNVTLKQIYRHFSRPQSGY